MSTIHLLICNLIGLGRIEYRAAWSIQHGLSDARADGRIADTLLVLEHPHTYTLGRSARAEHLLPSKAECARRGISVVEVNRGGDITYHGPGQLVAYPICYLGKPDVTGRLMAADYVGYIRRLEEVLIKTVDSFGLEARREEGYTGVWVDTPTGPQKIAAIGVRVKAQGVSMHGLALNVTTDLTYFTGIVPCGIADKLVTSLQALLESDVPSMSDVITSLKSAFERVFERQLVLAELDDLLSSARNAITLIDAGR